MNDGGPAFPRTGADGHTSPQSGMSLRDYFAAKALNGSVAAESETRWKGIKTDELTPEEHAWFAYRVADAMLKAREKK